QFVSFMSQVAASPTHTYIYLLLGLLGAVVFLLIIALIAHARVQYIEVIGAAFVIISIVLGVLVYVVLSSSEPVVPEGSGATNTIVIE
ncbi:hypothetical protein KKG57_03120, partial [Patescibacteria group bacterium]|nr:hypothetical protein [Patescibacteria group bacterium]